MTEPLEPPPARVFQHVSMDHFSHAGKHYLVYVDRLSGWSCIYMFSRNSASKDVVKVVRSFFVDLGVPVRACADDGPQSSSCEFQRFLQRWAVNHDLSTSHYPRSNGHAEAAVKVMKTLVAKTITDGNSMMMPFVAVC